MKKKVLLIGNGGREHALAWKLAQSPLLEKLYIAPGNAGTELCGENVAIAASDIDGLIVFAKEKNIDLVIVGPDDPLALGIVDAFNREKIAIFGPTKAAAELEWSKVFAKEFMTRHMIPTAHYGAFSDFEEAVAYTDHEPLPLVIKADGLARGKGVFIAHTKQEVITILRELMIDKVFGDAGNKVVIEEFLDGVEVSVHVFADGKTWRLFPVSQDYKRAHDNDMGLNTGGMGSIAPAPFVSRELLKRIDSEIVAPVLQGMAEEGVPFTGLLYPGLVLTKEGPKVLEFNVRFGDPEAETYMRLLETDLLAICDACTTGSLETIDIHWKQIAACTVMLVSAGYPGAFEKGQVIRGVYEAEQNPGVQVFHAATRKEDHALIVHGGRVLALTTVGTTLADALRLAYEAIPLVHFAGIDYRKDIGKSALVVPML